MVCVQKNTDPILILQEVAAQVRGTLMKKIGLLNLKELEALIKEFIGCGECLKPSLKVEALRVKLLTINSTLNKYVSDRKKIDITKDSIVGFFRSLNDLSEKPGLAFDSDLEKWCAKKGVSGHRIPKINQLYSRFKRDANSELLAAAKFYLIELDKNREKAKILLPGDLKILHELRNKFAHYQQTDSDEDLFELSYIVADLIDTKKSKTSSGGAAERGRGRCKR